MTMCLSEPLAYDTAAYAATLSHLGTPFAVPGWEGYLLRCLIPGTTDVFDAMSVWPYCLPPDRSQLPALRAWLQAEGFVTLRAFFRPDAPLSLVHFQQAGFEVVLLKDHFVFDATLAEEPQSAKTRANIRRGQRLWQLELVSLADHQHTIAAYHEQLLQRKQFRAIAALPPTHFAALVDVPAVQVLGALDKEGLGAALITVHSAQSVHFHVVVGAERAYRNCAFYALYQEAITRWASSSTLYLGGAPSSPNGQGIARFKRRFSNRRVPVYMLQTVLNPALCQQLVSLRSPQQSNWFPPYRGG